MEQKYQKGEWKVNGIHSRVAGHNSSSDNIRIDSFVKNSTNHKPVAEVIDNWDSETQQANAFLIAAAPDLFIALEDYVANQEGNYLVKSCGHDFFCLCPSKKARLAIGKAVGNV